MIEKEYKAAAAETLSILENMNTIDVKKIPQNFLDFLVELSSKEDRPKLNYSKPIDELNLKEKTREILGYIYIKWWSTKEEQELCEKIINNKRKNNHVSTNVKYELDDIFKTKKNNDLVNNIENIENKEIVEYKEENFIKKLINNISSFFKWNKKSNKLL